MKIYKIKHPKIKKTYENSNIPLTKAFNNNKKYVNDKLKRNYRFNQDIVNVALCHSLKIIH